MVYRCSVDEPIHPSIHFEISGPILDHVAKDTCPVHLDSIQSKSLDPQLPSPVLASCKMARHLTIFDQEFHEIMLARGFTPVPTQHSSIIPSQVIHGIAPNLTAII